MNRKWILAILALLLVLVAVTPALAAGPADRNRHENRNRNREGPNMGTMPGKPTFALTGTVTQLGTDSITVLVYNGNRYVKPYLGQELVILVTQDTRYWQWTPDGYVPISFDDVQVGDTTSMRGVVSEQTFSALRVTIDVPCCIR